MTSALLAIECQIGVVLGRTSDPKALKRNRSGP